eukprot:5361076-Amphidinium_carterae.1
MPPYCGSSKTFQEDMYTLNETTGRNEAAANQCMKQCQQAPSDSRSYFHNPLPHNCPKSKDRNKGDCIRHF